MRLQSTHTDVVRGLDAYFSPPEAAVALLRIEDAHLPDVIWEPAAGDGALVKPFRRAGFNVVASDIADYGLKRCDTPVDFLKAKKPPGVEAIVTNPPYKLATQFVLKALDDVPYVALLLRTNFLESTRRLPFFRQHPPSRIWISSRRLPMMHRHGWDGPIAGSNTCFAWFIWQASAKHSGRVRWFDWKNLDA